jgi:hypothetical protein
MDTGKVSRYAVLIVSMVVMFTFSIVPGGPAGAADPVDNFLPASGFSPGWALSGRINHYGPENLYTYINGEAELYMPYGFKTLSSAFYSTGSDTASGVVADIYAMGSHIDAFGIYSNYRDADAEKIKLGADGFVEDTQLMFYKDRYFVRLSASGTVAGVKTKLVAAAREIDRKLPGKSSPPGEIALINIPGVNPDTIRYLAHGVLGYGFFKKGLTADMTIDGGTAKAFVIINPSPDDASGAFLRYVEYLEKSGVKVDRGVIKGTATLTVNDPLYKGTCIRRSGAYIFGVTKLNEPLKASPALDRIAANIKAF